MSNITQIEGRRLPTPFGREYEKLLAALGTERFGATVRDAVLGMTAGARRLYLFEATSREQSSLQYFSGEPGLTELLPAYLRWYLREDPVGDAYGAAPGTGDIALLRLAPQDIASPGFRRRFFDDADIIERISIVQRGEEGWRGINVARHASDGHCSDRELGALLNLACVVLPMLPLNRRPQRAADPPGVAEIEARFAERHVQLTRRERQVCARAATGMSVEATALDLDIARTSVLTYRQRAYQRLGVSSPVELCALVSR